MYSGNDLVVAASMMDKRAYRNSWTLGAGLWTLDPERWTLEAGLWTLDPEPWTLDSGRRTLECGY